MACGCGMAPATKYKYVSQPLIRGVSCGWVAQKRHVAYRARFATQRKAANWIAAILGVSAASLRVRSAGVQATTPVPSTRCVGVTPSRGRWVARVRGVVAGRFDSESEAAKCVATATRVKVQALRRKGVPGYLARNIFQAAYDVFRDYVPGDYQSMIAHERTSAKMFREDSCMS